MRNSWGRSARPRQHGARIRSARPNDDCDFIAFVVLPVGIALMLSSSSVATTIEDLRRDYPAHERRIEQFYSGLTMQANAVSWYDAASPKNAAEITFWGGGDRLAFEIDYLNDRDDNSNWFKGGREIGCATPGCSFSIRAQRDGTLVVTGLRRESAAYEAAVFRMRNQLVFPAAAYSIDGTKITEFLTDKVFRFVSVEDEDANGSHVVKLSWRAAVEGVDRGGWFRFLADGGYVMTEFEIDHRKLSSAKGSQTFGKMEYKTLAGFDIPVLQSARFWSLQPDNNGEESSIKEYTITAVEKGVADPSVFELSHYDLEPAARKGRGAYFWLITVLVVSMAGAILFRYLANRAKKT